jgi:hypothetical protein
MLPPQNVFSLLFFHEKEKKQKKATRSAIADIGCGVKYSFLANEAVL